MTAKPAAFKFLQISDCHLDAKMASKRVGLPAAKRQERADELLQVLVRAIDLAAESAVDAVIVPGDLWDSESVTSRTVNRLIEKLAATGDIPVVIAPGNHDYYSADSLYSAESLTARGMRQWPPGVHIFKSGAFSSFRHPRREDVSFTGRAFTQNVPVTDRLLSPGPQPDRDCPINILVFHGSLDEYDGADRGLPGKVTAPFSAGELEALAFTYAAVGHYHHFREIRAGKGPLLGAYAGCPAGRSFDECGPRYVLLGEISAGEDGSARVDLEKVEIDKRRFLSVSCDLTGLSQDEVLADIEQSLAAAGARAASDVVRISIEGRHPTGGQPDYVPENLEGRYYHLVVDDCTRPDYLTERFDKRTTEGRFIQAMLDLKKKAESQGGRLSLGEGKADLSVSNIEDALYYGLDALKQKKVTVRNVD